MLILSNLIIASPDINKNKGVVYLCQIQFYRAVCLFVCLFVCLLVNRSESGFQLLVCSWDGSVAYADFTPDELGRAMTDDEKVNFVPQRLKKPSQY